ncbi:MAG: hypothetical protein HGB18_05410 [Candidatus Moranbacteria bacterium]|nr:hypothetical protein [Candidatus Moranbacteria bacterium]
MSKKLFSHAVSAALVVCGIFGNSAVNAQTKPDIRQTGIGTAKMAFQAPGHDGQVIVLAGCGPAADVPLTSVPGAQVHHGAATMVLSVPLSAYSGADGKTGTVFAVNPTVVDPASNAVIEVGELLYLAVDNGDIRLATTDERSLYDEMYVNR